MRLVQAAIHLGVRIVAVAFGLAGCGGPGRVVRVQSAQQDIGSPTDFEVLAAYWVDVAMMEPLSAKDDLRESRIVSDDASLMKAWRKFRLPGKQPSVNFTSHEVLFVATLESVVCGVLPVTSVELTPDRRLLLRTPRTYACPSLYQLRYLYLSTVPEWTVVLRAITVLRTGSDHDRVLWGWSDTTTGPKPTGTASPNTVDSSNRTVTLPARGGVELVTLEDGSRVWVAQHENGEITVLAGYFALPHSAVGSSFADLLRNRDRDYSVPTFWQPGTRCYNSLFDELGRPVFRALSSLDRYEFSLDPQNSDWIRIGERVSGRQGDIASKRCVPSDERVYSAYPRAKPSDPPSWFTYREHDGTVRRIATGVEFPLESPRAPRRADMKYNGATSLGEIADAQAFVLTTCSDRQERMGRRDNRPQ